MCTVPAIDEHVAASDVPANLDHLPTNEARPDVTLSTPDYTAGLESLTTFQCFIHPDRDDCGCQEFDHQWDLPNAAENSSQFLALDEPDYSKFENWIPQFVRPEHPCDYCHSRRLQCYFQRGEANCTPCNSLFRECSLTNSHTLEANNYLDASDGTFLDTLHVVDENAVKDQGTLTGIKPLNSKGRASGASTPVRSDDAPGSTKRNGLRFPRHAIKTLRSWFESHLDHPYPTEEEKAELERETELKPMQIVNWLANERRRRKANEKPRPKVMQSPSLKPATPAILIPQADKPWDELNPLERWKHSPPENEPALMTDIVHAVASRDLPPDQHSLSTSSKSSRRRLRSSNGSALSVKHAASTTSGDTSKQSSSTTVSSAAFSHTSSNSFGSFGSFGSGLAGKKDRRRRRKRPTSTVVRKLSEDNKKRPFQCTFCTDTFKSKYDWTRHEKSLHLSLEKWICAPLGPAVMNTTTGKLVCVYCNEKEPTEAHLESHNHHQCEEKGLEARTFYRKDHLRQHMRLMHGSEMMPHMETWKAVMANINSRCGFCSQRFSIWQERVDHLTAHFKAGSRMSEWKGCRGLDPNVAAQVTNAMPPYLIGIESVSPIPFSATNRASWRPIPSAEGIDYLVANASFDKLSGKEVNTAWTAVMEGKSTCWEILTVRLAGYATEQTKKGVVMTDEMLQQQARRILYDSDDSWNQTAADNPEWLDLFKKAHGLDVIPSTVGGQGLHVPEDLEWYGDLGLRIPFAVQLAAYNPKGVRAPEAATVNVSPVDEDPLDVARMRVKAAYTELASQGLLHDEDFQCGHGECSANVIDITCVDGRCFPGPRNRRWCAVELPQDQSKLLIELRETLSGGSSVVTASSPTLPLGADAQTQDQSTSQQQRLDVYKWSYMPRHKCELPQDKARRFATVTGAWRDSGDMPEPQSTAAMMHLVSDNLLNTSELDSNFPAELTGDVARDQSRGISVHSNDISSMLLEDANSAEASTNSPALPIDMQMTPEMMIKSLDDLLAAEQCMAAPMTASVDPDFAMFTEWPTTGEHDNIMDMDFNDITFNDDIFAMQLEEPQNP